MLLINKINTKHVYDAYAYAVAIAFMVFFGLLMWIDFWRHTTKSHDVVPKGSLLSVFHQPDEGVPFVQNMQRIEYIYIHILCKINLSINDSYINHHKSFLVQKSIWNHTVTTKSKPQHLTTKQKHGIQASNPNPRLLIFSKLPIDSTLKNQRQPFGTTDPLLTRLTWRNGSPICRTRNPTLWAFGEDPRSRLRPWCRGAGVRRISMDGWWYTGGDGCW